MPAWSIVPIFVTIGAVVAGGLVWALVNIFGAAVEDDEDE